jgi:hypothetical protein
MVVDTLMAPDYGYTVYYSDFNDYDWDVYTGDPGYLPDRARVTDELLPSLAADHTRNFYFNGHGGPNLLTDYKGCSDYNWGQPDYWGGTIFRKDIIAALDNHYNVFTGINTKHPYRFVWLDACSTAKTRGWEHAFGIRHKLTVEQLNAGAWQQAFVGWQSTHTVRSGAAGWAKYDKTLGRFFNMWMNNRPLAECLDGAATRGPYPGDDFLLEAPLAVPRNADIYNDWGPRGTCKMRIAGFPGLKRTGYDGTRIWPSEL